MHPRAAGTRAPLRARAHAPAGRLRRAHAHTHTHTRVPAYTRTAPLYPKKPTYPQVTCHSESLVLLCCPSSARLPLFCCGKRPHMSANTSRQEPPAQNKDSRGCLHLRTRQPVAIFKLVRSPPSEGTLLCSSLSVSLSSLPVQLLHNTHQLFIACLPVSRQNQSQMESLLMGSCRTCQQAICAQATTL